MKIKWGALVVDGRGKIGGQVASKNRSGAYMRTKVTPVNAQTTFQQAVRSRLADLSSAWRGLTQAERDAWDGAVSGYAKTNIFGDLVNPTGKNLHNGLNQNLLNTGNTQLSAPVAPAAIVEPGATTATVTDTTTTESCEIEITTIDADQDYLVFATAQVSPGINFFKNRYRQIMVHPGSGTTTIDALTAYKAKFGAPVAGRKASFKVVPVNSTSGQSGVGSSANAITTV